VNKSELVDAIAAKTGSTKADTDRWLKAYTDVVTKTLSEGDQVSLVGIFTLSVKERAARTARNPRTGEVMQIEAAKVPAFKAGKLLKDAVSGKTAEVA